MKHLRILFIVLVTLSICIVSALADEDEGLQPAFDDGRINDYDVAAPVAVFGMDFETGRGLDFWAPIGYENAGVLVLRVLPEDIAEVPVYPTERTLIATSDMIELSLYRMPDGRFEVCAACNEVEMYVLDFTELANNTGYTSTYIK